MRIVILMSFLMVIIGANFQSHARSKEHQKKRYRVTNQRSDRVYSNRLQSWRPKRQARIANHRRFKKRRNYYNTRRRFFSPGWFFGLRI